MNRCRFRKLIHRYYDGELSPQDLDKCTKHLEHCETCRTLLQDLLSLRTLYLQKSPVNPPAGFSDRIHARIQNGMPENAGVRTRFNAGALSRKLAPVAAALLLVFGGLATFLSVSQKPSLATTGLQYYAVDTSDSTDTTSLKDLSSFVLTEQEQALLKSEDAKAVDTFYAILEDTML